jgi:3'-phosphoadenosine 5'-phosphosulfate (PAPS) 3'-phosphatase
MRKPIELRTPLETIMREAGEVARATARRPFKRWTKGADNSPVSEADIAVNELLQARLPALAPQAGWLSEESELSPSADAQAFTWVVDPIDGTRAYLAGRADWTVSVALVEDGRPVLAALYAPGTAGYPAHALPAPSARSSVSRGFRRAPAPNPRSIRWRCGWPGWHRANSTPPSPRRAATTGTLQRPIFWCTKLAA